MSDRVKNALKQLLHIHGDALGADINRLAGLLSDACPSERKERLVVILALQEGIVAELIKTGVSAASMHALGRRLYHAAGIDHRLAEWALVVWAEALGLGCAWTSTTHHERSAGHDEEGWQSQRPSASLEIHLESLRFYESGTGFLPPEERQYKTCFPQSAARYIMYAFWVRNSQRQRDRTYQLEQRIYARGGELLATADCALVITAVEDQYGFSWGWGYKEAGLWDPGAYRVGILIDGEAFTDGSFTIEETYKDGADGAPAQ